MNDDSLMPFGKYKGLKMADVPVEYLHWVWLNIPIDKTGVRSYIEENLFALKEENHDLIWN